MSQVRGKVYNHLLDLRSLYSLVNSEIFFETYQKVPQDEKSKADEIIDRGRSIDPSLRATAIGDLRDWLRRHNHSELTIRELRDIAQRIGILHYSRLSKEKLLTEIEVAYARIKWIDEQRELEREHSGSANNRGYPSRSPEDSANVAGGDEVPDVSYDDSSETESGTDEGVPSMGDPNEGCSE